MTDAGSPFPPPTPEQRPTPAPAPEPYRVGEARTPWWTSRWAIVLPVVVLLGVIGAVVLGTGGDSDDEVETVVVASSEAPATTEPPTPTEAPSSTEAPPSTDVPSSTETSSTQPLATVAPPTTGAPATTVPPATTVAPGTSESTCGYLGTDDFDDMQVELTLTNSLGVVPSLSVTFALTGGDRSRSLAMWVIWISSVPA
jgi:hypothetical protein